MALDKLVRIKIFEDYRVVQEKISAILNAPARANVLIVNADYLKPTTSLDSHAVPLENPTGAFQYYR